MKSVRADSRVAGDRRGNSPVLRTQGSQTPWEIPPVWPRHAYSASRKTHGALFIESNSRVLRTQDIALCPPSPWGRGIPQSFGLGRFPGPSLMNAVPAAFIRPHRR